MVNPTRSFVSQDMRTNDLTKDPNMPKERTFHKALEFIQKDRPDFFTRCDKGYFGLA